ncbi:D-alanyl-D-alanine carboxypeptidase/D-alanyl-D-alanine-endopeptidase [Gloeomargarita lithophora Alchichica-D10]|uniref:D-alanyl-D-alanine carboxypeptidase/D-alanyl-D-alanine-endopeptidase n=1 Tax=Gloeomargarita lithophora Alchichica-D10 TaxID=1188229 RepID=A0A1J0AC55_9CYAN|nr:D-alanyl-D-alanine carboxypeptidase/D-alanyl-D-alanine-endopeptidase [Gloeomargarita lithophora]APB33506.1 D-alanyl-D-alanine carboxypeptidase/D-alanyl-D-alanine-endopeptidase [Gloeomargarita lithophora Alchichica-D10]
MFLASPPAEVELCRTSLTTALDQVRQQPEYQKAHWGILIQTQTAPPRTLYEHQSQQFFLPASTTKLLTTAGALVHLGGEHRLRTAFYQQGRQLHLVGQGDPTLTTVKLQQLVQKITPAQRQSFDTVVIQTGFFQGLNFNDQWEWQDILNTDMVPVNNLILNRNESQLRLIAQTAGKPARVAWSDPYAVRYWQMINTTRSTNNPIQPIQIWIPPGLPQLHIRGDVTSQPLSFTVPVLDTDQYLVQTLTRFFPHKKVEVRRTILPANLGKEVAAVQSVPVTQLVTQINQVSDNLYAEALLRHLGAVSNPRIPSDLAGIQTVQKVLGGLGVTPGGVLQKDGSGLSRHNRVTPAALVQMLQGMAASSPYVNSLAAPGLPGTLRRRFTQTDINLQAKTGTLSGVASLAGYLQPRNRPRLVFTIVVNQSEQPATVLRRGIDQMVMTVNDWAERSTPDQWGNCTQTNARQWVN